jgi:hypothetical protein
MAGLLKRIKWESTAWLSIGKHVLSFCWRGLPKDVHFSINYNAEDDYVNLHVTRNVVSQFNKPKIEIVRVKKIEVEEVAKLICQTLLADIFVPFDIRPFQRGSSKMAWGARYISFKRFEKSRNYRNFKIQLIRTFRQHSSIKSHGGRISMRAQMLTAFEKLFSRSDMAHLMMENIGKVPICYPPNMDFGMLLTKNSHFFVLRHKKQWYRYNSDQDPLKSLSLSLGPELAQELVEHGKWAIDFVSRSITYQDTEPYDEGITLFLLPGAKGEESIG